MFTVCDVDIEFVSNRPPYLIEGESMSLEVCILVEEMPGPFETPITIPLQIKEFVPKPYYYGYGYSYGYHKREAPSRMARDASVGDFTKPKANPAGEW